MAFLEKMKVYLDKGVEVSKEALSKAGDAVQDFSDKSVTKIEAHHLVSRQNKEYRVLGLAVRKFFDENPTGSLSSDNSLIHGILQEIIRLDKAIEEREESLRSSKNEQADSNKTDDTPDVAESSEPLDASEATDAEFTKTE